MNNTKWTAKELFNEFDNLKVDDFKELYKALLAREIGLNEYTDDIDTLMDDALQNKYYDNAAIPSFIDMDLVDAVHDEFANAGFETDNWC